MSHWFVGVDLAWSDRHQSGVAILRGDSAGLTFVCAETILDLGDIADRIRSLDGNWSIGIDAPLVVRSETQARPVDREISRRYGRFHAGAHSATLRLLNHKVRGGDLAKLLAVDGLRVRDTFPHAPEADGRWAFETYPHAGMVELFGLDRIFKYKEGRVADRRRELRRMADHFRDRFPELDPPLSVGPELASLLTADLDSLRGRRLKAHEDRLDALFCAYLAAHFWTWGDARNRLLGKAETGAVILPAIRDAAFERVGM